MSWNHRILKYVPEGGDDPQYKVVEVYYNEDGEPLAYADVNLQQDESIDCFLQYKQILKDLTNAPVITTEDFVDSEETTH